MIPKNAITMRGLIDRCWLVAFRADLARVRASLPEPLEPITHGGFAYVGLVVSHLSHMRPSRLPAWAGVSYWHVAYRIYARTRDGDGLYFLRSDADSPLMVFAGNALTTFRFHAARIDARSEPSRGEAARTIVSVDSADAPLDLLLGNDRLGLAQGSPFADIQEAACFLKYKPAALAPHGNAVDILRITRDESAWRYRLRTIERLSVPYLEPFEAVPEVAYEVEPIEYVWNRARRLGGGP